MTSRHFRQLYHQLLLLVACTLPFAAFGTMDEVISEKRITVAIRMIGHEVLSCIGDSESRILPIEKIEEQQYRIPFEVEFGFDPEDIAGIVDQVMLKTHIATEYLVEMVRCENQAVVHSFEIRNAMNSELNACHGRILPEDCYNLLITLFPSEEAIADISVLPPPNSDKSNFSSSILLIVPLLLFIGLAGYFMKKKDRSEDDPNLIRIGASQFDKRNMALSFKNKRVELSNKEADLLSILHNSANTPVERQDILHRVWGDEGDYVGRTLDVFISKLRKKLEADASVKIVNIRGVGYKLVMDLPK